MTAYDRLVKGLLVLGFRPGDPDEDTSDFLAYAGKHDLFAIKVSTHVYDWSKERGSFMRERETPTVSLYLPHSCDEWVIAPYGEGYGEGEGREVANSFAVGAIDAAILFNRTLDLIAKVQSGLNGSQS
jgi:hypothetical protein